MIRVNNAASKWIWLLHFNINALSGQKIWIDVTVFPPRIWAHKVGCVPDAPVVQRCGKVWQTDPLSKLYVALSKQLQNSLKNAWIAANISVEMIRLKKGINFGWVNQNIMCTKWCTKELSDTVVAEIWRLWYGGKDPVWLRIFLHTRSQISYNTWFSTAKLLVCRNILNHTGSLPSYQSLHISATTNWIWMNKGSDCSCEYAMSLHMPPTCQIWQYWICRISYLDY
jgi:hypothetical protein